jgi:DNA/RNA-binding domain of Phe-tRNA-synthetase-like protein
MTYEEVGFDVSDEVAALGLRGIYFAMGNIHNKDSDAEFEKVKTQTVQLVCSDLSRNTIENDPVLGGFRKLHRAVGRSNRKNISAPENLAYYMLERHDIPHVNLLVDIYNLVSIKTWLALGAHDLSNVSGDIHLRLTNGTERFVPLGSSQLKPVRAGEYVYVDDENDIICRLEVRQVEKTKVSVDTRECFFIIQGNSATDLGSLQNATDDLVGLIKRFCGGKERLLRVLA